MPVDITAADWMRTQEKRQLHLQRRGQIKTATDILGPGFGPRAVQIDDWNSDEASFNGYFWSDTGAANAPATSDWIGYTTSTEDQGGFQSVRQFHPGDPLSQWTRTFAQAAGGGRIYQAWRPQGYQTGAFGVNISSATSDVTSVAFPSPFVHVPVVVTNINASAGNTTRWASRAIAISLTGFQFYVFATDGLADSWSAVSVSWVAFAT